MKSHFHYLFNTFPAGTYYSLFLDILYNPSAAECVDGSGAGFTTAALHGSARNENFVPGMQHRLFPVDCHGVLTGHTDHILVELVPVLFRDPIGKAGPKRHLVPVRSSVVIPLHIRRILLF